MTEKPILFTQENILKILDDTKTQTRRPCKAESAKFRYDYGDLLWVRETYMENCIDHIPYNDCLTRYFYKADMDKYPSEVIGQMKTFGYKWRPSIYMPKEAARIFLEVEERWIERVQDISGEDAISEGVPLPYACRSDSGLLFEARMQYKDIWNSIYHEKHKPEFMWERNPWVEAYKFKRIITADI